MNAVNLIEWLNKNKETIKNPQVKEYAYSLEFHLRNEINEAKLNNMFKEMKQESEAISG